MAKLVLGFKDGESKWFERTLPSDWSLREESEDGKIIEEMDLDELKLLAEKIGVTMASNIGLETARTKLKAAIEAE